MRRFVILWAAAGILGGSALCMPAAAYPPPSAPGDAPVAGITREDLELARACMRDALDDGVDGIVHFWSNPGTRASGTVTALRWFRRQGMDCRDVEVSVSAPFETTRGVWIMCQAEEGWRSLGSR